MKTKHLPGIVTGVALSLFAGLLPSAHASTYQKINAAVCENGRCTIPQQNRNPRVNPAVVRIVVLHENTRSYGTGTFVKDDANRYFIMTCAHLFEQTGAQKITVLFPDRGACEVRLLALDRTWDLAILWDEIFLHGEARDAIPLGKTAPKKGEILYYAGYGSAGNYLVQKGRVEGYCAIHTGSPTETLVVSGSARQGDSGGPIVNTGGELVGVLWGTDGRTICGTYNGRIHQFLVAAQNQSSFFRPFQGIKDNAGNKAAEAAKEQIGESVAGVKTQIDTAIAAIENRIGAKVDGAKQSLLAEVKPVMEAVEKGVGKIVNAVVTMVYMLGGAIGGSVLSGFVPRILSAVRKFPADKKE